MNRLARKHSDVYQSVNLWIEQIKEEEGEAAYIQHEGVGAPFLIYWMSKWQKKVC